MTRNVQVISKAKQTDFNKESLQKASIDEIQQTLKQLYSERTKLNELLWSAPKEGFPYNTDTSPKLENAARKELEIQMALLSTKIYAYEAALKEKFMSQAKSTKATVKAEPLEIEEILHKHRFYNKC
jgi:hypothetical protein